MTSYPSVPGVEAGLCLCISLWLGARWEGLAVTFVIFSFGWLQGAIAGRALWLVSECLEYNCVLFPVLLFGESCSDQSTRGPEVLAAWCWGAAPGEGQSRGAVRCSGLNQQCLWG